MQLRFIFALFALLIAIPSMSYSAERGATGMTFTLDAEGMFWNPTVNSIKVAKVSPKSPAELSGIVVGDELVEVEGKPVVGSKGKELMALMQKDAGQTLKLKIKRSNGEILAITMILTTKS